MDTRTSGCRRGWGHHGPAAPHTRTRALAVVFGCVAATTIALSAPAFADPHDADIKPVSQPPDDTECAGEDVSRYPNGEIPESALCPLPQPGHSLRADAAAAFVRLDEAYQNHFGYPMCVTDAYRPLSEQKRLYEEKPSGMAAKPGTSEHGRGVAVDLCGGVNNLESPQHEWMMANAGDYGWHNPPWAQNGFEPWHWEYQE